MTRKNAREYAVQLVYMSGFSDKPISELIDDALSEETFNRLSAEAELYERRPDTEQSSYIRRVVSGVSEHQPELDAYIERYAVGWQFGRLPRVAVAIMRVSMFEVLYMRDIPHRAAINEAVEIAKKYESHEVVSFINGIMGSFYKNEAVQ